MAVQGNKKSKPSIFAKSEVILRCIYVFNTFIESHNRYPNLTGKNKMKPQTPFALTGECTHILFIGSNNFQQNNIAWSSLSCPIIKLSLPALYTLLL